MTTERDNVQDRVLATLDADRDGLVDLALRLGGIASPAGQERTIAEAAVARLQEDGIKAYIQPITEDSANAIGVLPGVGDGRSLIFDAHLDTGWPWPVGSTEIARRMETGFVEGDMIYGHGIINCKGQVAAFMTAARALKNAGVRLQGDLYVAAVAFETGAASVDEHQGINYPGEGMGSRWLIDRGIVTDYALIGETSGFGIVAAECGVARLKVRVPGRVVYTPRLDRNGGWQEGSNSYVKASYLVQAIEEWAIGYQERSKLQFAGGVIVPKAQVVGLRGGEYSGLGGDCDVHVDVRLAPGADPRAVQREVRDVASSAGVDCDVSLYQWSRGHVAQNAAPLIEAVSGAHRYVFGENPPPAPTSEMSMWRDLNAFNEVGIPSICYGAPRQFEPYTDAQDRAMKIDDLLAEAKVYAITAMSVCGLASTWR